MNDKLTPKAIVAALDAHIIGQTDAKKAVAVALHEDVGEREASARDDRRATMQVGDDLHDLTEERPSLFRRRLQQADRADRSELQTGWIDGRRGMLQADDSR